MSEGVEMSVKAEEQQRGLSSRSRKVPTPDYVGDYEHYVNPYAAHHQRDDIGDDDDDDVTSIDEELLVVIHEDQILPVGDVYPGEKDQKHDTPKDLDEKNKEASHSVISSGIEYLKYAYSLILLVFSVVIVMASVFSEQTVGTAESGIPPVAAFFIFWFLIVWLAMMEGGLGCIVGLQPIHKAIYAESHSRALKSTKLAHTSGNMKRFILGRQFLVVLIIFVLNIMGSAVKGASVLGMSSLVNEIFLASGVALILTTIVLGQLTAQVNAANCMLDFINNYFMLFTIYVSIAIEASGLLHSVYLVDIFFSKISGKPIDSNLAQRTGVQKLFFWFRVFGSLVLLGFSFAVTLSALFQGKSNIWEGIPVAVSVTLLFVLMAVVGMMEGMQIALFAVRNLPDDELQKNAIAHKNCQLAFRAQNLQAFLIGRQIFVASCVFILARITSVSVDVEAGEGTIFGVSSGVQEFFNTGLLGAIITTIVGSLIWRIIASSFPLAFLSNPLIYVIIRLCLILEATGICSAAWVLAWILKRIAGFQVDEVYVGTAEERNAAFNDNADELQLEEEGEAAESKRD